MPKPSPRERTRALVNTLTNANVHSFALHTVAADGSEQLLGIYATVEMASAALHERIKPGQMMIVDVWHPAHCTCPEAPN